MKFGKTILFKSFALLSLGAFLYTYIRFSYPNATCVDINDYFFSADEDRGGYQTPLLQVGDIALHLPSFRLLRLVPTGSIIELSERFARKTCRGPPNVAPS